MPHPRPVLLLATCLAAAPTLAAQEWQNLGSREVDFRRDRDVITVTASEGWFKAIKIEVNDGALEMYRIRVSFKNGERFAPETRLTFREDSRSRTIDLPGKDRVIRKVEFRYKSQVRTGRATVTLYGLRGDAPREGRDDRGDQNWKEIGSREVNFRAERDVISAAGEGRFRKLMLRVDDGDLEMFNVRVIFANGEPFSPETRLHFGSDSRSREIDLPGEARVIRRIEFAYKSVRGGGEGRATIHVYGKP